MTINFDLEKALNVLQPGQDLTGKAVSYYSHQTAH